MARLLAFALALAACKREAPSPAAEAIAKGQPPLVAHSYFRVDAQPTPACHVNAPCEAQLVLTALGEYHVNDDYPTKFVPDAASDVAVEADGRFHIGGAKHGTMTVRFTPTKPGPARLVGKFELSVCSDRNCQTASPKITLDVIGT
jgi:hypothetical protein